ncbi:hypothetical protein [Bradyrhizobium sp.]|uniref:hypothetical protein n=1 Tax=Bradyrhizobium sp. TaxID=376 RepID=UPI001D5F8308|nr:hypothetical protein [Bradyrhizobium sp.]MBI5318618.1 hypothetical protein [Bradyrhizobium sp.]
MPTAGDRLPADTLVTQMGLSAQQIGKLSAAGKAITKSDLAALTVGTVTANAAKATLGDIEVIKSAFSGAVASAEPSESGTNCCCTPCCCATAVTKPVAQVI